MKPHQGQSKCIKCNATIPTNIFICDYCLEPQIEKLVERANIIKKFYEEHAIKDLSSRDQIFETLLDSGMPLVKLAKISGLHHDTIRRAYLKKKGVKTMSQIVQKSPGSLYTKIKPNGIRFYCAACKEPVKAIASESDWKYCLKCQKIRKEGRDPNITLICINCSNAYHPRKQSKTLNNKSKYCSRRCMVIYENEKSKL